MGVGAGRSGSGRIERGTRMDESKVLHLGMLRAVLAILQWWGFNVTVIIMNKWIFQVMFLSPPFLPLKSRDFYFCCSSKRHKMFLF